MPSNALPARLAGQRLGPYVLQQQLGAGGMGEVYRARDTRLSRDVAIKLFPTQLAVDTAQRERFDREARLLAALNHPNIASVYGLEEGLADGRPISGIVLELVEGGTLAERLSGGAIQPADAVQAARQIAQALDAAHDKGIIHRDLKPANVALTSGGDVKILDFGIGRWMAPAGEPSQEPTVTEAGLVLGTPSYMSPEQARGAVVDKRTDIWGFGCVLYEMLTGRAAFSAATVADTLAAVLHRDPDWSALPPDTPPSLRRLLHRCLEKDPKQRLRDIGDAILDLDEASSSPGMRDASTGSANGGWPARWLGVGVTAVVIVAAWLLWPAPDALNPLAGATTTRLTDWDGAERQAAISHDGRMVAFLSDREGAWDAWVGHIGTGTFQNLTKGAAPELLNPAVRNVGFTPDGARVTLWVRLTDPDRGVTTDGWAVPTLGGRLSPYMDRYADNIADVQWSPDRQWIVYHTSSAGDPLFVTRPDEIAGRQIYAAGPGLHNHFPTWSPDGAFIYFVHGFAPDEMDLWRIPPAGGEPERLTFHESRVAFPAFVSRRELLYLATAPDGSGPWIHVLDVERRTSARLQTGLDEYTSLDASEDGRRLVVTVSRVTAGVWRAPLGSGVLGQDAMARLPLPASRSGSPRAGPGFIVYRSLTAGAESLWKLTDDGEAMELWNGREGRVISGAAVSPTGRQIAFPVQRRGATRLYVINADGSGVRQLNDELDVRGSPAWSPDGAWIATAASVDGQPCLFKLPVQGGPAEILVRDHARDPAWSPSGRFILFSGADVGMTFPVKAVADDGRPHPLPELTLSRGGRRLAFLGDDRSLIVLRGDLTHKEFWRVDLQTGQQHRLTEFGPGFTITDFDISPDQHIIFDRIRHDADVVLIERP